MGKLEGKRALITGASSGIGRGVAIRFAAEGARVGINYPPGLKDPADEVLERVESAGGAGMVLEADVGDADAVAAMVMAFSDANGGIDILVNNAGIATSSPLADMPVEMWDRMIAVHLRGTFLATKFSLPFMIAQRWGRIISTASQLGYRGASQLAHYCAAKAAIIGFTKSLARELAEYNILVNAVMPGPIHTPMTAAMRKDHADSILREIPLGRMGEVDEVVPTFLFLASEDATYYTGQTIGPNGGHVML